MTNGSRNTKYNQYEIKKLKRQLITDKQIFTNLYRALAIINRLGKHPHFIFSLGLMPGY